MIQDNEYERLCMEMPQMASKFIADLINTLQLVRPKLDLYNTFVDDPDWPALDKRIESLIS